MTNMISPEMQALWANDHAPRDMGMALVRAEGGQAEFNVTMATKHMNSHGIGHGGVIQTLADSAAGFAANSLGGMAVTQSNAITFLNAARLGDVLTARAELQARSGRSAIVDVAVTAADGRQIALLRAQMRYVSPKA